MLGVLFKETSAKIALAIFVVFTIFWLFLFTQEVDSNYHAFFGSTYGIMAAWGGIASFSIAKKWGGFKSVIGKAIMFFSFGLLFQVFGQIAYSTYIYVLGVELPYPSIGDIGYFGSIPIYIYATYLLAGVAGIKLTYKDPINFLKFISIPIIMLTASYFFFLRGYEFDWSVPLVVFLDFGYPFGQAIYVSIALGIYLLSYKKLGGIMRNKILFILFALLVQYFSDYTFLYQIYNDLWHVAGTNDFMYLVSYFLMTLALIQLKTVSDQLKAENKKTSK